MRWVEDNCVGCPQGCIHCGHGEHWVFVCDECGYSTTETDKIRYFHQIGEEDYCNECYRKMQEKYCSFGKCKKHLVCDKIGSVPCTDFEPCLTYMDKYNNDVELWEEMHGE